MRRYHQNVWSLHENKVPDLELLDANISVYLFWNTASLWNVVDTRMANKRSHTCISKYWSGGQYAVYLAGTLFKFWSEHWSQQSCFVVLLHNSMQTLG
jgi:hypothetical protein